jgi:hypothetical protein
MAYDKAFDEFSYLSEELQLEAIREAELRVQAQLTAATAADQRAMAWAGFLITIAVAATGGALSLVVSGGHYSLAGVAFLFAVNIMAAGISAMDSVRPSDFCFPGNEPANWLPANWDFYPGPSKDVAQARREQASALQNQIKENARWAKESGNKLKRSMDILLFAVMFWAAVLIPVVLFLL